MRKVFIPIEEYNRLKEIDQRFGKFLAYMESIEDIRESRKQAKEKKIVSQEMLFKKLGF